MLYGALLIVCLAAVPARAQVTGRLFGDFRVGAGYDDAVLRTSLRREDRLLPAALGLGWRGRFGPRTTGRAYYQFSYSGFVRQKRENVQRHKLEGELTRRAADPVRLLLRAEADWHRLPRRPAFSSLRLSAAPGVEYRPWLTTVLRGFGTYDNERYPNFDLDWTGLGWRLELEQELGLDGTASLVYSQRRRRFRERRLFADAAGAVSGTKRLDEERSLEAAGAWLWRRAGLRAGYSWFEVRSNGDRLDWGPGQSDSFNTVPGDERLVGEYFSRTAHGPVLAASLLLPRSLRLSAEHRWTAQRYPGRPAKDSGGSLAADGSLRRDWRRALTVDATWLFGLWGQQLGLSATWVREASSSTDALYTFTNNRLTFSFKGWF